MNLSDGPVGKSELEYFVQIISQRRICIVRIFAPPDYLKYSLYRSYL